ncbi:hypothetical protein M9H77_03223 [Catharanthus roseus]|uniref:Uncharacterized protein n=1 Tax=Catharanthus roseus TaxID=4058 RepID=A0ACC0CAN0_CATRO|nr:hypothetical protein M9H77_03223 [Catharanthus roseus]
MWFRKEAKGDYHGILNEILEVGFPKIPSQKVVLFKCDWFDLSLHRGHKIHVKYKLMELHIKRKYAGEYDPFILSHKAEQVTYVLYPTSKREKHDCGTSSRDSIPRGFDINETSRIDVEVQDIRTLIHESGELESVEIRGRNSIGDEDDNNEDKEEVEWESNDEDYNVYISDIGFYSSGDVCFSGYNVYTSGDLDFILQLSYSSLAPISTPSSSSSATWTLSRPTSSSSAHRPCHLCKVLLTLAFLSY